MVNDDVCKNRLKSTLKVLIEKNHVASIEADEISREFQSIISRKNVKDKLQQFNLNEHRLDTFLIPIFRHEKASDKTIRFLKTILCLFHGNVAFL